MLVWPAQDNGFRAPAANIRILAPSAPALRRPALEPPGGRLPCAGLRRARDDGQVIYFGLRFRLGNPGGQFGIFGYPSGKRRAADSCQRSGRPPRVPCRQSLEDCRHDCRSPLASPTHGYRLPSRAGRFKARARNGTTGAKRKIYTPK